MNIRLPLHILSAATVLLFAATACTQDDLGSGTLPEGEYPLVINATGLQAAATPASTKATVDGDWQGVQTVAVEKDGTVKVYDVTASDADGYKTATLSSDTDPFWWTSRDPITVSAWWPYDATDMGTMPAVAVAADQRTRAAFEGSDFISAEARTVQFDNPTLEFSHRTARITVVLQPGTGITSVAGADVSVTGLSTDNGNPATIRTYAAGGDTYEALTAPQTVRANTPFIQVFVGGSTFYFRPQSDVALVAGSRYTYTVSVTAKGLELAGCTIGGWTDGGSESGTAEDLGYFIQDDGSYTAYTANGLKEWAEAVQTDPTINCTLTADIDLTGEEWTPIGSGGIGPDGGYQGTFDGQGHSITGLNISPSSTSEYASLFYLIGAGGKVMNLQLKEVTYNSNLGVGGIASLNYGAITACSVTGTLTSGFTAGVVTSNYGTITACWFSGTTNSGASGIVLKNMSTSTSSGSYSAEVTACYWSGEGISNGIYDGIPGEATEVDGSTVTWQTAVEGMNAALANNSYQWALGSDGLPVLERNQ